MLKKVAASVFVLVSMAHPAHSKSWEMKSEMDPFTDNRIVRAMVSSDDIFMPSAIVVRCNNGKLEAFVKVGDFLGGGDMIRVRYRVDDRGVVTGEWSPSTQGTAAFARDPETFARHLIIGNYIVVEAEDFNGTPRRAKFPLSGSARTVGAVLDACGIS